MKKVFFFDMDGVLFDSMPHHAIAWEEVMSKHGLHFTARDCYLQEGRTGQSVIDECFVRELGRHATEDEIRSIYGEKSARFQSLGGADAMRGAKELLHYLCERGAMVFIVTGSGQKTLFDTLENNYPGVFTRERMVTAYDVSHGKPNPEPYLKAFEKASRLYAGTLTKADCCVVENAPLGIRAGWAAGFDVYAVNTGPLLDEDLLAEHPAKVFKSMTELLAFIKND